MGRRLRNLADRMGPLIDRIDSRVDRPAKARGPARQGSEQMIDDEMAAVKGRAVSHRRSGFGRGL